MSLYRFSSALFVMSVVCLAIAWGIGSPFYILCSWLCVLLSGQLYGAGVEEERAKHPARARRR